MRAGQPFVWTVWKYCGATTTPILKMFGRNFIICGPQQCCNLPYGLWRVWKRRLCMVVNLWQARQILGFPQRTQLQQWPCKHDFWPFGQWPRFCGGRVRYHQRGGRHRQDWQQDTVCQKTSLVKDYVPRVSNQENWTPTIPETLTTQMVDWAKENTATDQIVTNIQDFRKDINDMKGTVTYAFKKPMCTRSPSRISKCSPCILRPTPPKCQRCLKWISPRLHPAQQLHRFCASGFSDAHGRVITQCISKE